MAGFDDFDFQEHQNVGSPTMSATLSEDEIDDLLYFARTGDKQEFDVLKDELCRREKVDVVGLLEVAKDEGSGNGVLHMAAANGHAGEFLHLEQLRKVLGILEQADILSRRILERHLQGTRHSLAPEPGHVSDHKRAESCGQHGIALGCFERTLGFRESVARARRGPHDHEPERPRCRVRGGAE